MKTLRTPALATKLNIPVSDIYYAVKSGYLQPLLLKRRIYLWDEQAQRQAEEYFTPTRLPIKREVRR